MTTPTTPSTTATTIGSRLTCLRCGHGWHQRGETPPLRCPGCGNKLWQTPRKS